MRIKQGMPPTDTAEEEWQRMERNKLRQEQDRDTRKNRKMLEQQLPPNGVKTTAPPRPNSYLRPDLPLPQPYGHFAPFKPSEPGSNMRHIVKPTIREIET